MFEKNNNNMQLHTYTPLISCTFYVLLKYSVKTRYIVYVVSQVFSLPP